MGDDVAATYGSQLLDLKMNSKPVINVLTMMAEDYIRHAPVVVQTIERHLNRVHPGVKLPVLYLIDSIVKNVKKEYDNLFTQNIVSTFCGVFEKVDEKVKAQMFKLRQTWTDVFPQRKLYAIDVRCHQIDKNWPISAPPSNNASIHVNPKFLNTARPSPVSVVPVAPEVNIPAEQPSATEVTEAQMRAKLLQKKKELLELQQKKIELELMQTKAAIESKQLEEMESAMKTEKMLLQQAEIAKSKTVMAGNILSTYPNKLPSNSVVVVPLSVSQSLPATSTITDPRLIRQMENKARTEAANLKSGANSSGLVKHKIESVSAPVINRTAHDSSVPAVKSIVSVHDPLLNEQLKKPIVAVDSQLKKKNHDVVEIDMFKFHSRNKQKENTRSASKEKELVVVKEKREKESKHHKKSLNKDGTRDKRSRSKEIKLKDKIIKKDLPELVESDDYDNEIEEGLNIQPKRLSVSDCEKDSSVVRSSPINSIKDEHNSPSDKSPKRRPSPSKSDSSSTKRMRVGNSLSPLLSSHSPKLEGNFDRRSESSKSPEKRSRSRTSSERSDKEKDRKEKEIKHSISIKDKKEFKGRNNRDKDKRSPNKGSDRETFSNNKSEEWKTYEARRKEVLNRNYRKRTGTDLDEEENKIPNVKMEESVPQGDVDLRFPIQGLKDVDLRPTDNYGTLGEPPTKKPRSSGSNSNIIDDLFGREDIDSRPARSGSWSQVKKPREDGESSNNSHMDEDIRDILQQQNRNRPPPPVSPAHSVSSVRSSCDPLGRPRLYDKLPDDPEERKRSLDTRSSTIDPVERFRREYIDPVLNGKGELSTMDVKHIFSKAQEHVDEGILNTEQYLAIMKQITQINEASAMREVQQMQMRTSAWQEQNANQANPWNAALGAPVQQGPWAVAEFRPRGPTDHSGVPRFPSAGPPNTWGPRMNMGVVPWNNPLPGPKGPNPFEEALMPRIPDLIPPVNEMELRAAERDTASSIPIDKIMRQLRFYGDQAVIMMGRMADEPKQISFQRDGRPRTLLINGKPMELSIGELKHFELNRKQHTLKIGAPTRELYIDDRHYEVCFGGPAVRIPVDGRLHTFEMTGPPPQVEVGKVSRHDLVAGRVHLIVDAVETLTLYLDEKPQKLDLFSEPVILRFCDGFRAVMLNGRPFPTNFGARLPFTVTIPNAGQHFFRFSALNPNAEKAIGHFVRARQGGHIETEDGNSEAFGPFRGRGRGGFRGRGRGRGRGEAFVGDHSMPAVVDRNPLDMLTNLFPSPRIDPSEERRRMGDKTHSYESEAREESEKEQTDESGGLDVTNLLALAAKLGLLPSSTSDAAANSESESPREESPVTVTENKPEVKKVKEKVKEKEKPIVPPLATVDVSLVSDEKNYFKERRDTLIIQLWTGVQCASCGLRFPPDQTVRYSQHLDWHFRHNRREKSNSKKAQSRKWYYDLSDWIQFEEFQDLEDRAQSLFEIQEEEESEQRSPGTTVTLEESTVLASGHEGATCPQCGEAFESFFDEEKEEWRLKGALLDEIDNETKVYHPVCHQDYLKSLVEESMEVDSESLTDQHKTEAVDEGNNQEEISTVEEEEDEVLILKEGKKEVVLMEIDVDLDEEDGLKDTKKSDETDNTEKNNKESENGPSLNSEICDNDNSEKINADNVVDKHVSSYLIFSKPVQSPITINDEDSSSNMLPGISEDSGGGVFGFALNSGILREGSDSPVPVEERKIVYKSMKFDFPVIKIEPPDEVPDDNEPLQDPFLESTAAADPEIVSLEQEMEKEPIEMDTEQNVEPVNIDLTADDDDDDDDSMDGLNGGSRAFRQITAIDGNLQQEEKAPVPFVPPAKIRINISGLDVVASKSPQSKLENETTTTEAASKSPSQTTTNTETTEETQPKSPRDGDSSAENSEIVFTDELKRLKPRLFGRKLVNCPPKQVGKEESGLCTIC